MVDIEGKMAIRAMAQRMGERLAQQRRWVGISQSALGKDACLSKTTIAQIEKGHVPKVSFIHIAAIARRLGLSMDALLADVWGHHANDDASGPKE